MARTLSSDEVGVIADQTICGPQHNLPFMRWAVLSDWRQQQLIDFANKILDVYGSDPLSLVTAQREAWDSGVIYRCSVGTSSRNGSTMEHSYAECIYERDRRFPLPLPAPPAPEPVLSPEQVSGMVSRWNQEAHTTIEDFARTVERSVLTAQQERAK